MEKTTVLLYKQTDTAKGNRISPKPLRFLFHVKHAGLGDGLLAI